MLSVLTEILYLEPLRMWRQDLQASLRFQGQASNWPLKDPCFRWEPTSGTTPHPHPGTTVNFTSSPRHT